MLMIRYEGNQLLMRCSKIKYLLFLKLNKRFVHYIALGLINESKEREQIPYLPNCR